MDDMKGGFITRPPVLDGTNYPYWKNVAGVVVVKQEVEWSAAEEQISLGNNKALNAIFYVVNAEVFKMISSCTVAKEAWEVLKMAYEGTQKVRMYRL
ncbi:hypothetical protein LIER_28284 [Lithospermum erythrorhizon]|uniref:Gag-pol polyprotein n=1 Tax=Lithospermum erythrorhizon TaxID=34254 RepID=A0AAV3RIT5_LITER